VGEIGGRSHAASIREPYLPARVDNLQTQGLSLGGVEEWSTQQNGTIPKGDAINWVGRLANDPTDRNNFRSCPARVKARGNVQSD
jgi:hypothetical protein